MERSQNRIGRQEKISSLNPERSKEYKIHEVGLIGRERDPNERPDPDGGGNELEIIETDTQERRKSDQEGQN